MGTYNTNQIRKNTIQLQAKRVKTKVGFITELCQDGKIKAIIPATQRQPRKGTKVITLNCWTFSLVWENDSLAKNQSQVLI